MKQDASFQYGVFLKKAFPQPDIFTAFVEAVLLDVQVFKPRKNSKKTGKLISVKI